MYVHLDSQLRQPLGGGRECFKPLTPTLPYYFQSHRVYFCPFQGLTSPCPFPKGITSWITDVAETTIQAFSEHLVVFVSTVLHFVDKFPVCTLNKGEYIKSP